MRNNSVITNLEFSDVKSGRSIVDDARARLADALVRTADGDREAFRDVYALTSAKLFGICLRVCGERAAAEDVLHEVYCTIWKLAGDWDALRTGPITWLATIAINRAINWRRAQGRRPTAPLSDALAEIDPAPDPDAGAQTIQETRHLHSCLDRLEPNQADAIRTAFFQGLTYGELAQREGIYVSTMKSRLRRGLAHLKMQLDKTQFG